MLDVERLAKALCAVHHPPSGRTHPDTPCVANRAQAEQIAREYGLAACATCGARDHDADHCPETYGIFSDVDE